MNVWRTMGTTATLVLPDNGPAEQARIEAIVRGRFAANEAQFSRFRPGSELSRLNRGRGSTRVSEGMWHMLCRARAWFRFTAGRFDPTVGGALVAHGYDRPFLPGILDRPRGEAPVQTASFADVMLTEATREVTLAPGVALDFGGFVKGCTVDIAARDLPANAALDAGGDGVVRGRGPGGEDWTIEIEDPRHPERIFGAVEATDVAFATSGTNRRHWKTGGETKHHLIDPETGSPARTDLIQATVLAETAEMADVLAKTAVLLGANKGGHFLSHLVGRAVRGAVLVPAEGSPKIVGEIAWTTEERR